MTKDFVLRPEAERDLRNSFDWYEKQRPGLGAQFIASIQAALDQIKVNPELHPIIYKNLRRAVIRRFPYSVFYFVFPEKIHVLAVLHHRRNPAGLAARVKPDE